MPFQRNFHIVLRWHLQRAKRQLERLLARSLKAHNRVPPHFFTVVELKVGTLVGIFNEHGMPEVTRDMVYNSLNTMMENLLELIRLRPVPNGMVYYTHQDNNRRQIY